MHFQSLTTVLFAVTTAVSSFAVGTRESDTVAISVQLTPVEETKIKATVSNGGEKAVTLLKFNTALHPYPGYRANVFKNGKELLFEGFLANYDIKLAQPDDFVTLNPGNFTERIFDVAETADLSSGGTFRVMSKGFFHLIKPNTRDVVGIVKYQTNELELKVDGSHGSTIVTAARADMALSKRSEIVGPEHPSVDIGFAGCSPEQATKINKALEVTTKYCEAGIKEARTGDGKEFFKFFKSKSPDDRQNVAKRLEAIIKEIKAGDKGHLKIGCFGASISKCNNPGITAAANHFAHQISFCEPWFKAKVTGECHKWDQASVALHEYTHLPKVYSPGTDDIVYGYQNVLELKENNLQNADTYAYYAADISRGCK